MVAVRRMGIVLDAHCLSRPAGAAVLCRPRCWWPPGWLHVEDALMRRSTLVCTTTHYQVDAAVHLRHFGMHPNLTLPARQDMPLAAS